MSDSFESDIRVRAFLRETGIFCDNTLSPPLVCLRSSCTHQCYSLFRKSTYGKSETLPFARCHPLQ